LASKKFIEKIQGYFTGPDLSITLQDFTDEEVQQLIMDIRPRDWWDLEQALLDKTNDKEVESHLLGFPSYEARQAEIEKTKELQRKVEEWINEH